MKSGVTSSILLRASVTFGDQKITDLLYLCHDQAQAGQAL